MTHPSPSGPQPSGPGRLPRLGEVVRDVERLVAQARSVIGREIDPASRPDGTDGHLADASLQVLKFQLEAAMREVGEIAALSLPPVGSAVKLPARQDPDAPPRAVASGRGAGPGFLGPIAQSITESLSRRSQ